MAKKVYTIERHRELSESAQAVLGRLGFANIEFYIGDGSGGWPEERAFDRIMITAAIPRIAQQLTDQLAEGGIMIAPVGPRGVQSLVAYQRKGEKLNERFICDVRFVKLIGEHGFDE